MANEYASTAELKDYLGISDTDQDDTLDIILEGASRAVDDYCHRHFYAETTASARTYTSEGRFVFVDDISTTTDLVVKSDEGYDGTYETTWTRDQYTGYGYRLHPRNALDKSEPPERLEALANAWPYTRGAVEVTAKWGWPAVPAAVKEATLIQAHSLWSPIGPLEDTGGAPGVASVSLEGSDSISFESSNVALLGAKELDAQAKRLLTRYRKTRLVW